MAPARRLCRQVEVYTPSPGLLSHSQKAVYDFLSNFSPLGEPSRKGFYLNLTGTQKLLGLSVDVGGRIIRELDKGFSLIRAEGIASNKLVS